jgi:hypothetical protein
MSSKENEAAKSAISTENGTETTQHHHKLHVDLSNLHLPHVPHRVSSEARRRIYTTVTSLYAMESNF